MSALLLNQSKIFVGKTPERQLGRGCFFVFEYLYFFESTVQ